jgi:hypothetical protein
MICQVCNAKLSDSVEFCTECGVKISNIRFEKDSDSKVLDKEHNLYPSKNDGLRQEASKRKKITFLSLTLKLNIGLMIFSFLIFNFNNPLFSMLRYTGTNTFILFHLMLSLLTFSFQIMLYIAIWQLANVFKSSRTQNIKVLFISFILIFFINTLLFTFINLFIVFIIFNLLGNYIIKAALFFVVKDEIFALKIKRWLFTLAIVTVINGISYSIYYYTIYVNQLYVNLLSTIFYGLNFITSILAIIVFFRWLSNLKYVQVD